MMKRKDIFLGNGAVALGLVELARRAALARTREGSLALIDLLLAHSLPGRFTFALIAVGLAVSCTAAWFAVRHTQGLRRIAG